MARQRWGRNRRGRSGGRPLADLHERPPPPVPWLRMILTGLFGLVVLMAGAAGLIRALIDTEAIHAEAQAALAEITGREVRIGGRLQVVSYFSATIAFDDIAIANRPGADVPDMVRIGRVEAELSLLALVSGRTEIQRLVISEPVITLEVDAEGRGNWQNQTAAADAPTMARAAARLPPNVHVKDGRLAFTDARSGRSTAITLRRVSLAEGGSGGLLTVAADLAYGAQRFSVNGQVGSWARLVDRTAAAPDRKSVV